MEPTRAELDMAACWEAVDRVPRDPEMTAFKRRARHQQARWRERNGLPIGHQPTAGGDGARPLGSRLELKYARATGANFITDNARRAARDRLAAPERHQTLTPARLWADLLSSMPMCFNLLGDLHTDLALADQAARRWWPDLPGTVSDLRFEWSPGRADPAYLNNRTAFDAALLLDLGAGARGVLGIETKYHEHPTTETAPPPDKLRRYIDVSEQSGVFRSGAIDELVGTPLQQIWLDHLLTLAMLQHSSCSWTWGRFVLVHPAGNVGFVRLARQYSDLLVSSSTFEARTLEDLLAAGALVQVLTEAFRDRYLWTSS